MIPTKETPAAMVTAGARLKKQRSEKTVPPKGLPDKTTQKNGVVAPEPPQPLPWPSSFRIGADGVYHAEDKGNGEFIPTWKFSLLSVEARTCDTYGKNWGLLLKIQAPNGTWHHWAMPASLLGSTGSQYRETLFSLGLRIQPADYKHLHTYLATANPANILLCVDSVGWHQNNFVLPDATFTQPDNTSEIVLQKSNAENPFMCHGTLQEWQEHIGRICEGNSRLAVGVSAAFAAPLLNLCGHESCGLHFTGNSSTGKTTLLFVAGSVCGGGGQNGYLHRWRVTDNALESIALAHNDCLLCMDEIGQLKPKDAAESAYMLANGQGKVRANKDGSMRTISKWRVLFLSSGELTLEQKLQEDGRRFMAGQAVRVISIPADAGMGFGIYENLYDLPDGKSMSDVLLEAANRFYGTPLRCFLRQLTARLDESRGAVCAWIDRFEREVCPPNTDGQVRRVCRHFALIAAGGELATRFDVLPWPQGTAFTAARRCFHDWVACRGGLNAAEAREAIRRVQAFIAFHGASRFANWDEKEMVVHNRVGFKRKVGSEVTYLFFPPAFEQEICNGLNHKAVARYLLQAGFLDTNGPKELTKTHTRYQSGCARYYTVREDILSFETD